MGHPEMETEESLARQWEARCEIAERGLKRWHEAAKVWLAAGKRALEEQRSILDALGWSEDCADGPIALIEKICRDHNKYQQIAYAAEDDLAEAAQTIQRQAAEIDSLRAGLRALTNIRDESAAETHRWRERALKAEAGGADEAHLRGQLAEATRALDDLRERYAVDVEDARDCKAADDAERCGDCQACLRASRAKLDQDLGELGTRALKLHADQDRLKAEVEHLKAKRAAEHAEAERVVALLNRERETLDTVVRQFDGVKARLKTLCRTDLNRPASIGSQASRSLAWSVLRELGVTVPDGEPETPAVSSPAGALVDPMRSIAQVKPTAPMIDPGEGWRLLRKGEKIEKGDEVYFDEDDWFESVDVGLIHLGEDDPPDMVRRRRIAAPPPAEPVAYPPSSAPEAVEVAPPQPAPVVCSADVESSEPRAQRPEQHEVAPPVLPAPRPVLPRPMPPELRAAIIRAQMAGGRS